MAPLITIAVPSFNQGRFLEQALASIFDQDLPVEVFVADAGSSDETMSVLERWASRLAGWRSHADAGQAAAITIRPKTLRASRFNLTIQEFDVVFVLSVLLLPELLLLIGLAVWWERRN